MLHLQQLDNLPSSVIPQIDRAIQSHCQEVLRAPVNEIQIYNLEEEDRSHCAYLESHALHQCQCQAFHLHQVCAHTHAAKGKPSGCRHVQLVGSGSPDQSHLCGHRVSRGELLLGYTETLQKWPVPLILKTDTEAAQLEL